MQLDDVVDATHTDEARFEEARHRTVRWLDRCIKAHVNTDKQNLFPIVQGGLDQEKRKQCAQELIQRNTPGNLLLQYLLPNFCPHFLNYQLFSA